MKLTLSFCLSVLERFVACVLLFCFFPTLLLIALLIWLTVDRPVIVMDELPSGDRKSIGRCYHFRTTGHGPPFFRMMGRFLRAYSFDELPGLWNVALGDMRLKDFFRLR